MPRILMVHDAETREPESVARQVRRALEPVGYTVAVAADPAGAAERFRHGDFDLLFVQVPTLWQCSEDVRLLLLAVPKTAERKLPRVLIFRDTGIDGPLAVGYMSTPAMYLLSHAFHANELRAFVRRMLEQP